MLAAFPSEQTRPQSATRSPGHDKSQRKLLSEEGLHAYSSLPEGPLAVGRWGQTSAA